MRTDGAVCYALRAKVKAHGLQGFQALHPLCNKHLRQEREWILHRHHQRTLTDCFLFVRECFGDIVRWWLLGTSADAVFLLSSQFSSERYLMMMIESGLVQKAAARSKL